MCEYADNSNLFTFAEEALGYAMLCYACMQTGRLDVWSMNTDK